MDLITPVARYADRVLDRCRDRFGPRRTPLLADGLDLHTHEPIQWEQAVPSNLASQQAFLRTLVSLDALTDNPAYGRATREWIDFALQTLADPVSDLLYWGGHTTWDLAADAPLLGNHELKSVYPDYAYLHHINPDVTARHITAFWDRHIWDWSTLLFNRHGEYVEWNRATAWQHTFAGGPVPIVENTALSFINTGSDLIHAAVELARLENHDTPLTWAMHLLSRYEQIRHEDTGLAGYQFNHREPCRVRASFKPPLGARAEVNEVTVIHAGTIQTRYGRAAIALLNLHEQLHRHPTTAARRDAAQKLLEFVVRDLTALAAHSWDPAEQGFHSVLADGTRLSPSNAQDGVGYCRPAKLGILPPNGLMLLAYARAFRLTADAGLGDMARTLASSIGLLGEAPARSPIPAHKLPPPARAADLPACSLVGLVDLHAATGERSFLNAALTLAATLLEQRPVDRLFTPHDAENARATLNDPLPVALLHVAVAQHNANTSAKPTEPALPPFYASGGWFDPKVIIARRQTEAPRG